MENYCDLVDAECCHPLKSMSDPYQFLALPKKKLGISDSAIIKTYRC